MYVCIYKYIYIYIYLYVYVRAHVHAHVHAHAHAQTPYEVLTKAQPRSEDGSRIRRPPRGAHDVAGHGGGLLRYHLHAETGSMNGMVCIIAPRKVVFRYFCIGSG